MTKMVTRCPQCGTSFRITSAQLQTARGAVRCGGCLHIFRAQEHLVGETREPAQASALIRKPTPKAKPAPDPNIPEEPREEQGSQKLDFDQSLIDEESGSLDDDDFLISDDMGKKSDEDEDQFLDIESNPTSSLFEREIKVQDEEPEDATDESWAMSLLEEEDENDSVQVKQAPAGEPSTDPEEDQSNFERDLEATFALVEDEEAASAPATRETQEREARMHFQLEEPDPAREQHYAGERMSAYDSERTAMLMGIDPEPVEMTWTQAIGRRRKLIWAGLALVALIVLVIQVAWLQFDRLSRIEPYRTVYAEICPLLGCEVPGLADPSQIRAYNLVVRDHPDAEGALIVDAILLNNAPFEQPFPSLVLEFSNLDGQVVASRQFNPDDYLSGELAGRTSMPPNRPVHLTLELVDPGPAAVNYRAYIPQ